MLDTVLFDYDGTLINTNDIIIHCLNATSRYFTGHDIKYEDFIFCFGKLLSTQMEFLGGNKAQEMCDYYCDLYYSLQEEMEIPFDGAFDALKSLKQKGFKTGIVSSKATRGLNHGLDKFNLRKYVDVVISSDDTEITKPDPFPIQLAMDKLSSVCENTVFVGDSPHDIGGAINANIKSILVNYTIFPEDSFKNLNPTYTVAKLIDILDIIGR